MRLKFINKDAGFVAFFITILVLAIMLGLAFSITILVLGEQRISKNIVKSTQAYYIAEAGVEDALLRLKENPSMSAFSYVINNIGQGAADVDVSETIGGSRTITSQGDISNRIRKIRVVYAVDTDEVSFYYGIQVGDLGLEMNGNALVHGNIFSNGTIKGASNTKIYGDAISAGPTGKISSIKIEDDEGGGNAWATTLEDCTIDGDAHYINIINSSVGGSHFTPEQGPDPESMPISNNDITEWKSQAAVGGTISGYSLGGNDQDSLGPIKVQGDMTVDSNAILEVTGTIWVTGDLTLSSNVILYLDSNYGSNSGVIVVDGSISVDGNVILCGSEGYNGGCNPSVGSYLMLLSTKSSSDPDNPAIYATSNTETAVLYASDGFIRLGSNASLKEATGYGIYMDSNAEVTYELGLADTKFSSGPGGSWQIKDWSEVE